MTIFHCINSLGVGGAEVLLRDTVQGLPQHQHIICFLRKPDRLAAQFANHVLHDLQHSSWKQSFSTCRKLKQIIRKHQPDIIHAHLFEASFLARVAAPKPIPFYFTIHNILSKDAFEINRLSLIAEKLTYKKRHHLIAVSGAALNDYDKWVGIKGKADVLYNYVSQKFFDLQYDYTQEVTESFRLVAVGNLRRQKNYPALLEAFKALKDLPVSLDIYGEGDQKEELQKTIDESQLKVRLMGRVNEISEILLNYHAYIMPSLFEGFGIAPMEAMAAGMPVILSDLEVFREIGETLPVYFNPNEPISIAHAIRKTVNDWNGVKARARLGKDLIAAKASKEVYFKRLLEIYSSK